MRLLPHMYEEHPSRRATACGVDVTRPKNTTHQMLRDGTADLHEAVEAHLELSSRLETARSYGDLLGRFLSLLMPIEQRLGTFTWPESLALEARSKVPLILADLRVLGLAPDLEAARRFEPDLPLHSPASAYGCLYVLEGATLGGRLILKEVTRRLGFNAENGASFFAGYCGQTGPMWISFLAALGENVRTPGEQRQAVSGARATFAAMDLGLNGSRART